MMSSIETVLQTTFDPFTELPMAAVSTTHHSQLERGLLSLSLEWHYPLADIQSALEAILTKALVALPGVEQLDLNFNWRAPMVENASGKLPLPEVRTVIPVASGKGGVGKSTTTANLAVALARLGANVGILDADIYGPNQPHMLGVAQQRPEVRDDQTLSPVKAHGIQLMSMGLLLTERTPAVWRGPMATGALQQLLHKTAWDDLDYLLVDMPPGTGDIQLTLAQQVPVTAALIITTPQDIARLDAQKAIEMFDKVKIPVLGIIENMAGYQCPQCGYSEAIFGSGGGSHMSEYYRRPLLGSVPLHLSIRQQVDHGQPSATTPMHPVATVYEQLAKCIALELAIQCHSSSNQPKLEITES